MTASEAVWALDYFEITPSLRAKPIAPAMLAAVMGDPDAVDPAEAEKARQLIALRTAAPKRETKPIEAVADVNDTPLFIAANEPRVL